MKRIFVGIVLDVIAAAAMLFFIILPTVTSIDSVPGMRPIMQTLLCERGETVEVESRTFTRPGRVSTSANFYCERESGARRDVTGKAALFGIVGFGVPLALGILLIIWGSISMKSKEKQKHTVDNDVVSLLEGFGISIDQPPTSFQAVTIDARGQGTVTDRLKALKAAYEQGLITQDEYESKRKEILQAM